MLEASSAIARRPEDLEVPVFDREFTLFVTNLLKPSLSTPD